MSKTITIANFQFTGVEATEVETLENFLEEKTTDEIRAICHEWNNSCETVEDFIATQAPSVLAELGQKSVG
jgi:hypothetical protein